MSEVAASKPRTRRPRAGRTVQGRRRLRAALAVAAMDLFASQGFENTTVDQIAEAANVGRRTFFRYFRSKEDVVFPDHDERVAEVVRILESAEVSEAPLAAISGAAQVVLELYLDEPEISLKRFELTKRVPSLRDKEIVTIDRYQRVFARYLQERYGDRDDGALHASVIASAVVAAHNHVLREWLKSGGEADARAMLRDALERIRRGLRDPWDQTGETQLVVGVIRTGSSAEAVMQRVRDALGEAPTES